jgi:hypothetical protein
MFRVGICFFVCQESVFEKDAICADSRQGQQVLRKRPFFLCGALNACPHFFRSEGSHGEFSTQK